MMSPSSKDSQNKLGGLGAKKAAGLLVLSRATFGLISKAAPAFAHTRGFAEPHRCRRGPGSSFP